MPGLFAKNQGIQCGCNKVIKGKTGRKRDSRRDSRGNSGPQ